jgi:hypothetical protein
MIEKMHKEPHWAKNQSPLCSPLWFETNNQSRKMNQAVLLLLVVSSVYCGTGYHIVSYFEDSVCS